MQVSGERFFYRWMHRGREADRGTYRDFYEAVRRALAMAEVRAVAIIRRHMGKSWRVCMAWLERRHRNRWGVLRREDIEFRPRKVLCDLLNLSEDELFGFTCMHSGRQSGSVGLSGRPPARSRRS